MTGFYCLSKAGHDKDQIYVVVKKDDKAVYVADGKYKTVSNPKKKNPKHVKIMSRVLSEDEINMVVNLAPGCDEMIKHNLRELRKEIKA